MAPRFVVPWNLEYWLCHMTTITIEHCSKDVTVVSQYTPRPPTRKTTKDQHKHHTYNRTADRLISQSPSERKGFFNSFSANIPFDFPVWVQMASNSIPNAAKIGPGGRRRKDNRIRPIKSTTPLQDQRGNDDRWPLECNCTMLGVGLGPHLVYDETSKLIHDEWSRKKEENREQTLQGVGLDSSGALVMDTLDLPTRNELDAHKKYRDQMIPADGKDCPFNPDTTKMEEFTDRQTFGKRKRKRRTTSRNVQVSATEQSIPKKLNKRNKPPKRIPEPVPHKEETTNDSKLYKVPGIKWIMSPQTTATAGKASSTGHNPQIHHVQEGKASDSWESAQGFNILERKNVQSGKFRSPFGGTGHRCSYVRN